MKLDSLQVELLARDSFSKEESTRIRNQVSFSFTVGLVHLSRVQPDLTGWLGMRPSLAGRFGLTSLGADPAVKDRQRALADSSCSSCPRGTPEEGRMGRHFATRARGTARARVSREAMSPGKEGHFDGIVRRCSVIAVKRHPQLAHYLWTR